MAIVRLKKTDIMQKYNVTQAEINTAVGTLGYKNNNGYTQEQVDKILDLIPNKKEQQKEQPQKEDNTQSIVQTSIAMVAANLEQSEALKPTPTPKKFSDFLKEHFVYDDYINIVKKLHSKQTLKEIIAADINRAFLYIIEPITDVWKELSNKWFAIENKEFDMYEFFEDEPKSTYDWCKYCENEDCAPSYNCLDSKDNPEIMPTKFKPKDMVEPTEEDINEAIFTLNQKNTQLNFLDLMKQKIQEAYSLGFSDGRVNGLKEAEQLLEPALQAHSSALVSEILNLDIASVCRVAS